MKKLKKLVNATPLLLLVMALLVAPVATDQYSTDTSSNYGGMQPFNFGSPDARPFGLELPDVPTTS